MTMVLEPTRIETESIRVVLANDRGACDALVQALDGLFDEVELCEISTLAALGRALSSPRPPDLLLLDLALPKIGGFPGLLYLRSQNPDVPIAVVSATGDGRADCRVDGQVMRRAVEAGAAGFLPRDADAAMVADAIRGMLDGEIWTPPCLDIADLDMTAPLASDVAESLRRLSSLTPQQLRVLTMLAQGLLNKQVAYELSVSEATVKAHVSAILQKLGVDGRAQAVAAVRRLEGGCFTRELPQR